MTVTTVGGSVVPPIIFVEPWTVHVSIGGVYVTVPQIMTPVELVTVVAPVMDVVVLLLTPGALAAGGRTPCYSLGLFHSP